MFDQLGMIPGMTRPDFGSGPSASGAYAGAEIDLGRPPCGPPPGRRRPWEWTAAEPILDRERRLASMTAEAAPERPAEPEPTAPPRRRIRMRWRAGDSAPQPVK
jgi:hypothetical protein